MTTKNNEQQQTTRNKQTFHYKNIDQQHQTLPFNNKWQQTTTTINKIQPTITKQQATTNNKQQATTATSKKHNNLTILQPKESFEDTIFGLYNFCCWFLLMKKVSNV